MDAREARRFGIDRSRIATGGASAGGYLAQMTGFCLNPRPRALVSYFGYGDIVGPWYSQPDEFYRTQPLVSKKEALSVVGVTPISDPPQNNQRDKFYVYCGQNGLWTRQATGRDPQTEDKWFNSYHGRDVGQIRRGAQVDNGRRRGAPFGGREARGTVAGNRACRRVRKSTHGLS